MTLSLSFFLLRGLWMINDNPLLEHRVVRVLPHVIDTVLLLAAVCLVVISQQYPLVQHWLTVKIVLLVAYVTLGVFALRKGKTRATRITCLVLASLTFAFMVSVAMTRQSAGVFSLLF